MIKPKKIKKGSKIAVISPCWGGPSIYPDIYEKGIKNLEEIFEFEVIEYPTARMNAEEIYSNPKLRANDINNAFSNEEIDAIFVSIGGYESIRILKFLDIDLILKNPKIIMGYSDAVTFLSYLNYKGLVTFHGPAIMAGWAQLQTFDYLADYYKEILLENNKENEIKPFSEWSDGYPDWADKKTLGEVKNLTKNKEGFKWIQGNKKIVGKLWGGCVEVLNFLNGTDFWPDKEFWNNKILLIETSEEKPSPAQVGYIIRNFGIQGILNKISGILIGRPKGYSDKEKEDLFNIIKTIATEEFNNPELLIIGNMDFGHTDPNLILPLGIDVEIDPILKKIIIKEEIYRK